jgi:hypothetical protein
MQKFDRFFIKIGEEWGKFPPDLLNSNRVFPLRYEAAPPPEFLTLFEEELDRKVCEPQPVRHPFCSASVALKTNSAGC